MFVDNAPLRDAFRRSGISPSELARQLDFIRADSMKPETVRVSRALGLLPYYSKGKRYPAQQKMRERTALRYARALNVDPWELGL